jgi:beta-barrel assembly-enhancing protease
VKRALLACACAFALASAAYAQEPAPGDPTSASAVVAAPETPTAQIGATSAEEVISGAADPGLAPAAAAQPPAAAIVPPPSRARPAIESDEGGLWGLSDRAEQSARASGQLESDPALNAYLREISCRVANEFCGDIRLYVMNRPFFNASMAPNGYMEVWSGLLLRVEDEAQLAFILGHEIGHYSERHTLSMLRTLRGRANMAMVFSIAAAAAGVGLVGDLVYLGTIASVFGFSREQESEADLLGHDRAVAAGYDPRAGVTLWTNLMAETQASDNPDTRREATRPSAFNSHPLSEDRLEALSERAGGASGGETHREHYRAAIRPFLDDWLRAELRRRDYGETSAVLDRLAAHGEDLGVIEYFRGEINRLRRAEGDRERAIQHYTNAIAQPDAPAAAWRELGEFAARDSRNAEAAGFFSTYLQRAPDAADKALVEARIAQLTGGGQ